MNNAIIPMPIFSPVRIPTKGLSKFKRFLLSFKARTWRLEADYFLFLPWLKETLLIPKGFIFDAASTPNFLWPILPPTGILLLASIFHDWGYKYNCFLNKDCKIIHENAGQCFFDEQLRKISVYVNEEHVMEDVSWLALSIFGFIAWNKHRKENSNLLEDYPDRNIS
jgi:hypothetical protein